MNDSGETASLVGTCEVGVVVVHCSSISSAVMSLVQTGQTKSLTSSLFAFRVVVFPLAARISGSGLPLFSRI